MNVLAGIRAGASGFKAFPPEKFSGSGVGFEPRKIRLMQHLIEATLAALTVAGAAQVAHPVLL